MPYTSGAGLELDVNAGSTLRIWASVTPPASAAAQNSTLVLKAGYMGKSHVCLSIALRHLYVGHSEISEQDVEKLVGAMYLRNEADYDLVYSDKVEHRR